MKTEKSFHPYILAILHMAFAMVVMANELMSITNRVPGGNFPIEHQGSWGRVLLFAGSAVINGILAWIDWKKVEPTRYRLSGTIVFLVALIPTALSVTFSGYTDLLGWCCETPPAFFFGFPFSFLFATYRLDSSLTQNANLNIFQLFYATDITSTWRFEPYPLFLNFLFWAGVISILLSVLGVSFHKKIKESS